MGNSKEEKGGAKSKKSAAEPEEGGGFIQLPNENVELIKNSQGGIRRMPNDLERSGYKEFIIDRAKSQQDIDTKIDRIDDEFRKNESSEESHELEREEYQNTGNGEK